MSILAVTRVAFMHTNKENHVSLRKNITKQGTAAESTKIGGHARNISRVEHQECRKSLGKMNQEKKCCRYIEKYLNYSKILCVHMTFVVFSSFTHELRRNVMKNRRSDA